MKLGLYRQPVINFQGPKPKGQAGETCQNFNL